MRVTIDELASRLGLSSASVSYALNGQPGVSDATRARVQALAAELNWRPSSTARALSRSRSDAIGMILRRDPSLLGAEPYYMNLISGIERVLSAADLTLLFRMVGADRDADASIYRRWSGERRVDGVLLFDHFIDDDRPALLESLDLPFVAHGSAMTDIGGPTFIYDLVEDASLIIDHLSHLGHRSVLHITGSHRFTNELNRITTMRESAGRHAIRYRAVEGDYSIEQATQITHQVLLTADPPSAIVTSNDLMALGVTAALRSGRNRPTAVVAFDDSLLCRIAEPSVTALERFTEEQGQRSTRMLLALRDGTATDDHVAKRSQLVVRASSVAAA